MTSWDAARAAMFSVVHDVSLACGIQPAVEKSGPLAPSS